MLQKCEGQSQVLIRSKAQGNKRLTNYVMQITDKHKTIGVGADCSDTGVSGRKLLG